MISGDYRQQELRLLAHLSNDKKLCSILSGAGDPFRLIAADWHGLSPEQVPSAFQGIQKTMVSRHFRL